MASSDHMASVDPWPPIQPAFFDLCFADFFSRDADALTKTFPKSLSSDDDTQSSFASAGPKTAPKPAVSGVSASSDPDSAPKRLGNPIPVPAAAQRGRVTKRKSRASKRSHTTTFIAADAANFRQMVQQVTGVRFGTHAPVLKPEPQRATVRRPTPGHAVAAGSLLPTLGPATWPQNPGGDVGQLSVPLIAAPTAAADSELAGVLNFDSVTSFPTLESWKFI